MISKEAIANYLKENRGWILVGLAGSMISQELVILYSTANYLGIQLGIGGSDEIAIAIFRFMNSGSFQGNVMRVSDVVGSLVWIPLVLGMYFWHIDNKEKP